MTGISSDSLTLCILSLRFNNLITDVSLNNQKLAIKGKSVRSDAPDLTDFQAVN